MDLVRNQEKISEFENRAKELVEKMSLEDKVLQTLYQAPALEELGIKAYNWWNEALHGVARAGTATVFPQAIALAATFDEDLAEEVGEAVSTEGRAKFNMQESFNDTDIYKGLTFWSPNVNIFRDPRWGRGHETFGEDPYLTSRMGVRYTVGLQGHNENYLKAAACAKHFAVHSGPEDIRHEFNAQTSIQDLYETYLPAFKACVQEGKVEAVMGAYNRTNGTPCCGNKDLLIDILREEWGFKGHVVSDCWAIQDFHEGHHVTNNALESAAMAMNNGCDLNCGKLFLYLKEAVENKMVDESRLDEALIHLFTTRMKLGVFDEKGKNPFDQIPYSVVDSAEMQKLNERAAEKSVVLLKNENNLLPLDKNKIKTIGIIGPNANNRKALVGNYEGTASRYITVSEGIQDYVGNDVRVLVSEGCHLYKDRISDLAIENDRISEVKGICRDSDVIILCMGLDPGLEGEDGDQGNQYASGDKKSLDLPGIQEQVVQTACEFGKPVIMICMSGSALALNWEQENIPGIIQSFYPGARGGKAIAEVLFGKVNPQGKLPVTFYRTTEELPAFTDYSMKERTYRYMTKSPLYPFGYGLSYSSFECSDFKETGKKQNGFEYSVTVENNGKTEGTETVQVYVKAMREGTPNAQLKKIIKATLKAGEKKTYTFTLPEEAFGLYDEEGKFKIMSGTYEIYAGSSQPDARSEELTGKKVSSIRKEL